MYRDLLIADALRVAVRGDCRLLADLAGLVVVRRTLAPASAIYLPPPSPSGQGVLAIERTTTGVQRNWLIALGLAHVFLRHVRFDAYLYGIDGRALYSCEVDELSAREFASHLLKPIARHRS